MRPSLHRDDPPVAPFPRAVTVASMKETPRTFAILFALIVSIPLGSGAQGGPFSFLKRDPEAAILRKAKKYNLVPLKEVAPKVFIDLRYKFNSATGKPLYPMDMPCLAHRSTAEKVRKVNEMMNQHGYALKIWDAWRPSEAQQALWDAVQDPDFVVPPSRELSWHCYGISIDLTLVKLDGTPVEMPTGFDEFSPRAASNYQGGDPEIARRLSLLQKAMRDVGFRTITKEWWHFDDMKAQGGIHHASAADLGIRMP